MFSSSEPSDSLISAYLGARSEPSKPLKEMRRFLDEKLAVNVELAPVNYFISVHRRFKGAPNGPIQGES